MKKKILVYLPVYNSFKNLPKIFRELSLNFRKNIPDVLIVDNASTIFSEQEKINSIKKIKSQNKKINIFFLVNNKNYGIGGSMKIMINFAKKYNYQYVCSLLTSGRYNEKVIIKEMKKRISESYDYIIFSRFKIKGMAKNYNKLRYCFNIFFINMTKILTKCYFTDPGSIIFLLKLNILNKINFKNITNGSHFGHFLNIYIYKINRNFLEIPMKWGEGNIRSHLNSLSYVIILASSLLKYFFTGEFFKEKNNSFKFNITKF